MLFDKLSFGDELVLGTEIIFSLEEDLMVRFDPEADVGFVFFLAHIYDFK